jgi:hypothetical protein
VWVGLKACGCCVAVVVDQPEHANDVEKTKREFLSSGLSVIRASWQQWCDVYLPSLQSDCTHKVIERSER